MAHDPDYGLRFSAYVLAYLQKQGSSSLGTINRKQLADLAQGFYDENQPKSKPKVTRKPPAALQDGDAWLVSLETDPTYLGVNIMLELGKHRRWTECNKGLGSQVTRRSFVNWLNRAERPISATLRPSSQQSQAPLAPEPPGWRKDARNVAPDYHQTDWPRIPPHIQQFIIQEMT